jgi:hypothetical protein
MFKADQNLMEKWSPVLKAEGAPSIEDNYKASVTARLLENQETAMRQDAATLSGTNFISETTAAADAGLGTVGGNAIDPVLISLVRRAMPNLIAYDIAGVQPMTGPTGLIFAMKSQTVAADGTRAEALFGEADTSYSGVATTATTDNDPFAADSESDAADYSPGVGLSTPAGEAQGGFSATASINAADGDAADAYNAVVSEGAGIPEMGFSIEKVSVTAKTRALKANYTMELAQDLKAIHGLDAESELANILSSEILAEINREVVRTVNLSAKRRTVGGSADIEFDLVADSDGRWMAEKAKSLLMEIEVQANAIAIETRRGKGNYAITSANVASVLAASGDLNYSGAGSLNVDPTGNTFAGTLPSGIKVYVDPYATVDYVTVGYRGSNPYDAGLFYCPYVPLQMVKAVGENDFQPRIGFKTRYGMVSNPFTSIATDSNSYFRKFKVSNINVKA